MKKYEIIYKYNKSIPDSNTLIAVKWARDGKAAIEFMKKKKDISIVEVNEIHS